MGFEKWTAKSRVFRRPTITLARDARTFYLNRTALAGLGGADWVSLWFDPGRRMVSIRPAKPTEEGSYHIMRDGERGSICCQAFAHAYGLSPGKFYPKIEAKSLTFWVGGGGDEDEDDAT